MAAGQEPSAPSDAALEQLCRTYWPPLYAYVRRKGFAESDAQDLTQEFFARFLSADGFGTANRERGKFRTFLLASLNHFLINEWKRERTLKRGGGITFLSLDELDAENRQHQHADTELTPEKLYDRRWAQALLDHVLAQLRREYFADGKESLFEHLRVFLTDVKGTASYSETAERTGLSEGAAKQAVRRLRHRYREQLRIEISNTVSTPMEVEEEIQHLFAAFGS
jgi:RNA polymerase sigma-70 factor (ECF subfamily)